MGYVHYHYREFRRTRRQYMPRRLSETRTTLPANWVWKTAILDESKNIVWCYRDEPRGSNRTADMNFNRFECHPAQFWSLNDPMCMRRWSPWSGAARLCRWYKNPFGIREFQFTPTAVFSMMASTWNSKEYVCTMMRKSWRCRSSVSVWELRLKLLKEMGANAIRTSHNPPRPEFLRPWWSMGFLLWKKPSMNGPGGKKKWLQGLECRKRRKVQRDCTTTMSCTAITILLKIGQSKTWRYDTPRSQPSVLVLWSIGNESTLRMILCGFKRSVLWELEAFCEELIPVARNLLI